MLTHCYAIYDVKAGCFQTPFFMPALGMATRAFENLRSEKSNEIGRNPEDYTLWYLGSLDDQNGVIEKATVVTCCVAQPDGSFPAITPESALAVAGKIPAEHEEK